MKPVKYSMIAYLVKISLMLTVLFTSAYLIYSLLYATFGIVAKRGDVNSSIEFGTYSQGIPLSVNMSIRVPEETRMGFDSLGKQTFNLPVYTYNREFVNRVSKDAAKIEVIRSEFVRDDLWSEEENMKEYDEIVEMNRQRAEELTMSNRVFARDVLINVQAKNPLDRIMLILFENIERIFWLLTSIILIKLVNAYLSNNFMMPRSFRLLKWLGLIFIFTDIAFFIGRFLLTKIGADFSFKSLFSGGGDARTLDISFSSNLEISFDYTVMGILIILLAEVIRQGIETRKEIEYTV